MNKILYLGIDAPSGVYHYPVIRTEMMDSPLLQEALFFWKDYTHVIFTSKSAVSYWSLVGTFEGKTILAIGPGTANELEKKGVPSLVAPYATQEGMMELIHQIKKEGDFFFYPRSSGARPHLETFLRESGNNYRVLDLYKTVFQKKEPVPNPYDFDEIVFTSPSTVDGFLKIFGELPKGPKLMPIGPITERKITGYKDEQDKSS